MEALLREAGDGMARGDSGEGLQCRSAGELTTNIAQLLSGKVSETRAEHVSASYEIPADVVLNMSEVSSRDADIHAVPTPSALPAFVTVREVVVNQPVADQDPLAQKAVAAFLMTHVRQADGSVWDVQSTTRATQGWTVSYICQHSMVCWKQSLQQKSTRQKKHVVGLSITADMKHTASLARPAFDCRGVVNITFSRFSRSVVVKYEHTNFHCSVSDLVKLFPPPRPPSLPSLPETVPETVPESTNKRIKDAVDDCATAPKQKRPRQFSVEQDGGEAAEPAAAEAEAAYVQAQDAASGAPPGAKPTKPRKLDGKKTNNSAATGTTKGSFSSAQNPTYTAGFDARPGGDASDNDVEEALLRHLQGAIDDDSSTAADIMDTVAHGDSESGTDWQPSRKSAAAAAEQPRPYMLVTEAEVSKQRKATAIKLLRDRGVEPGTLTHEQFCTFSNQAPDLQTESLDLLAYYGAERLAIVPASNAS